MPAEPQAPTEHSESQGEGEGEAAPASAGLLTVFIYYESLKLTLPFPAILKEGLAAPFKVDLDSILNA